MKSGSLWNYYRDEINVLMMMILQMIKCRYISKSWTCMASKTIPKFNRISSTTTSTTNSIGSHPPRPALSPITPLNTEVTISLKYLSHFWKSPDLLLIKCEVEFDLKWSRNCILKEEDKHT